MLVWLVRITYALVAIYALLMIWGLLSPGSDPQRGVAQGMGVFVLLLLAAFAGLVWFASHPYRPILIWILFALAAYPAIMLAIRQIYLLWQGGPE